MHSGSKNVKNVLVTELFFFLGGGEGVKKKSLNNKLTMQNGLKLYHFGGREEVKKYPQQQTYNAESGFNILSFLA